MARVARALDTVLVWLERLAVILALVTLLVLSIFQMVARNLEFASPSWIDPVLHQLVLWGGFIGAALAVRAQTHIRFDLFQSKVKGPAKSVMNILIPLGSAFVCLLLANAAMAFVHSEKDAFSRVAGAPGWIFPIVIPVAFVLMAIHFLLVPWLGPEAPSGGRGEGQT